jgi:S1-C subfamily serine protease
MRLLFLLFFSSIHALIFSQIKIEKDFEDPIAGIYQIQLKESYNEKGELIYSTFFEGEIIISASNGILIAKKAKNGKPYFSITRNGTTYKINDQSEISMQEGIFTLDEFKGEVFKLKLWSKNKEHLGWYSVYTIKQIKEIDLFKNVSQGTGFLITKEGHILTNYHVVANSQLIKIKTTDNEYECDIVFTSEIDDLAIIKVKGNSQLFSPIAISLNNLNIGEDVIALGYPLASSMGEELKMSTGIVNSIKGFQDDTRYFQLSAPIDPGNSGGPVLNRMGNLIGLVTSKYSVATNAGYALKVQNIIMNIPTSIKIQREKSSQTLSNSNIYSKYKNSLVLIKAYSL